MKGIINWITQNWAALGVMVLGLMTAAGVIVKFTKVPWDDELLLAIRKFLEFISLVPKESALYDKTNE